MKKNDIFESEEFQKACDEVCNRLAEEYPNSGKHEHSFSKELDEKIAKLSVLKPKRSFKIFSTVGKRIAIAAIIAALLLATVFSVDAVRIPVFEFFSKVYKEFTSLFIDGDSDRYGDAFEFTPKSPSYSPEGTEVEKEYSSPSFYQLDYSSGNGIDYCFKQDRLYQNQKIDKDNYNEVIELNGKKYYYYISSSEHKLIWYDEYYSYMLSGNISKDELLKIACSVQ